MRLSVILTDLDDLRCHSEGILTAARIAPNRGHRPTLLFVLQTELLVYVHR